MNTVIDRLLHSCDPLIQYKLRCQVLGEAEGSPALNTLRPSVRESPLVKLLLSERGADGRIAQDPYKKWNGAHWVLPVLADLGYPSGDERLRPLAEQDYDWISSEQRLRWVTRRTKLAGGSPIRSCGSMEGATIFSMIRLGFMDTRCDQLVERLLAWQWPDGGWNCDVNPVASNSSFMETLLPLRALNLYAKVTGDSKAATAAARAADIFLKRNLFSKIKDGSMMDASFIKLHYPCYWHYDVLNGLKAMAECGYLSDPRCTEALDWLESRCLLDGGFPADGRFYHPNRDVSGFSRVDWGPVSLKKLNPYVTADALYVLHVAGRE